MSALNAMTAIQKAEMAVGDLASGGKLTVEQFKEFMRIPIKESMLMKYVRIQPMDSPTMEISKISAPTQVLHGASSGQALTSGQRSKPGFDKVELESKLLKGAVPVPDEALEDNIERERIMTTIREVVSRAIGADMEKLMILGDTADTSAYASLLSVHDGIIKLAATNVAAIGGLRLSKGPLETIDLAMPHEFRMTPDKMVFLTSYKAGIFYRSSIAARQTQEGDKVLVEGLGQVGGAPSYALFNGMPVMPIPLFPENLGGGLNETVVLYLNPKVIVFGVQRELKFELERDPSAGSTIIHISTRVATKFEHEPMVVKGTGILIS
jgi:hypothetical protein